MTTLHLSWHRQQTEWTAPRAGTPADNSRPDAALQWGRKPPPLPQDSGPLHQSRRQWRPRKRGTPCTSRPKVPSLSSLVVAPLLLNSWHFPHNPTLPSLASPTSDVGQGENVCSPEVSQNLVVTMSQHRDVFATNTAIEMAGFCRNICRPSQKKLPNIIAPPQVFFILYVLLDRNRRRGSPMLLSSLLVSLVSPNRETARDGLCFTCSKRLKTPSKPVNSKCAWKISRMERKYHECEQETLMNYQPYEEKKTIHEDENK